MKKKIFSSVLLLSGAMAVQNASACAVCMGAREDHVNTAIGNAMLLLLVFVFLLSGSFIAFMVYLAKRDTQLPDGETLSLEATPSPSL